MRDPELINTNEDTRLVPVWSIVAAAAVFVLVEYYFWLVFPQTPAPCSAAGTADLSEPLVGAAGVALLPDGWVREQGCAAAGDEFAVLDADLLCDAGRDWGGAVLPAASAAGFEVPGVRDACAERFPFLPAVQLPVDGELRELLQDGAGDGPVLHAMRA